MSPKFNGTFEFPAKQNRTRRRRRSGKHRASLNSSSRSQISDLASAATPIDVLVVAGGHCLVGLVALAGITAWLLSKSKSIIVVGPSSLLTTGFHPSRYFFHSLFPRYHFPEQPRLIHCMHTHSVITGTFSQTILHSSVLFYLAKDNSDESQISLRDGHACDQQ